jgi:hypothetical protein
VATAAVCGTAGTGSGVRGHAAPVAGREEEVESVEERAVVGVGGGGGVDRALPPRVRLVAGPSTPRP